MHSGSDLTWSNTIRGGVGSIRENQTLFVTKAVLLHEEVEPVGELLVLSWCIRVIY